MPLSHKRAAPPSGTAPSTSTGGASSSAVDFGSNAQARRAIAGSPGTMVDEDGHQTAYDQASIEDSSNAPELAGAAALSYAAWVERHATEASPVSLLGSVTPRLDELYTELDACAGEEVTALHGTLDAPARTAELDPDSLYIGGAPSPADIEQGFLGDCYLLATLASVTQEDPTHIVEMIELSGNSATVDFFYYDAETATYEPEAVTVDTDLMMWTDEAGDAGGLMGAALRVSEEPSQTDWWAGLEGTTLSVHAAETYQGAMWVPIVEKAYQRFIEVHGQYGGAPSTHADIEAAAMVDEDGQALAGAQIADGGWEHMVYPLLYGNAVERTGTQDMNWSPEGSTILQNADAIRQLLMVEGVGISAEQRAMVTVGGQSSDVLLRLQTQIETVADHDALPEGLLPQLQTLSGMVDTWWEEETTDEEVGNFASALAAPDAYDALHATDAPAQLQHLLELLLVAANLGTDESEGQRNVYTGHAYSVQQVVLRNGAGEALDLDPAGIPGNLTNVSSENSYVVIRNPHHTNEPDMHATGVADGQDDGEFSYTLDQFFRNFTAMDVAVVRTGS
jgi:hypothetical protein